MKDIYLDLEWFLDGEIFLISYAYNLQRYGQLYDRSLTKENILKLFRGVENIWVYGPDIGRLEKHYDINLRHNHRCLNLLTAAKNTLSMSNYCRLSTLEKHFGFDRKENYKTNIWQLWTDWKNPHKRAAALTYNMEDTLNLLKVKRELQKIAGLRELKKYELI